MFSELEILLPLSSHSFLIFIEDIIESSRRCAEVHQISAHSNWKQFSIFAAFFASQKESGKKAEQNYITWEGKNYCIESKSEFVPLSLRFYLAGLNRLLQKLVEDLAKFVSCRSPTWSPANISILFYIPCHLLVCSIHSLIPADLLLTFICSLPLPLPPLLTLRNVSLTMSTSETAEIDETWIVMPTSTGFPP